MVKLHLFSGFENRKLGITPDTQLGHLYSDNNNPEEVMEAGERLGVRMGWLQSSITGTWHFDLWGHFLADAKQCFPAVSDEEFAKDMEMLPCGVRDRP